MDHVQELEARDDAEAILMAQAKAAEPDRAPLAIELTNTDERLIWSLMRAELLGQRPDTLA